MSANAEEQSGKFDSFKWLMVFGFVAAAVWGNQHFQAEALPIRVLGILVVAGIALLIALSTTKGRNAFQLIKDSNVERRKVVWPVRQEAVKTTLVVFVFVTIVATFIWLLDMLLISIVTFLTQ